MHRIVKAEFEAFSKDVLSGKWDNLDRLTHQPHSRFELFPKPTTWFKSFPLITYLLLNGAEIDIARGAGSAERDVRRFNFFSRYTPVAKEFVDIVLDFFNINSTDVYEQLDIDAGTTIVDDGISSFRIKYDKVCKIITSRITCGDKVAVVTNPLPPLLMCSDGHLRTNYFVTVDNPLAVCLTAVARVKRCRDSAAVQLNKDGLFDDSGFITAYKGFAVRLAILLADLVTKTNAGAGMGFSVGADTMNQAYDVHKTTCALLPQTNYHYQIAKGGSVVMRRASPSSGAADGRLLSFSNNHYSFHGKLIDEIWRVADRCRIKSRTDDTTDLTQNYRAINDKMFIPVKTLEEAIALDKIFFTKNVQTDTPAAFTAEFERIAKARSGGYIALVTNKCVHIGDNILRTTVINLFTGSTFLTITEDVTELVNLFESADSVLLPKPTENVDYFIDARFAKIIGILLTKLGKLRIGSTKNMHIPAQNIKLRTEVYEYMRICGVNVSAVAYDYSAVGYITVTLNN